MRSPLLLVALSALACEPAPNAPQKPTIQLDRNPVALPAAYVGTTQQETLQVLNRGIEDLVVTKVTLTSESDAFGAVEVSPALPATIPYSQAGFVKFPFHPTKAGKFEAHLVIESNAAEKPSLETTVTGCAVEPGKPADGC